MAVPKRKTTKSRAGKRRSHLIFSSKNIIEDKDKFLKTFTIDHDKKYRIPLIKRAIAMANGQLTQSYKVKRDSVLARYGDELPQ